jgi:hypothetical protein
MAGKSNQTTICMWLHPTSRFCRLKSLRAMAKCSYQPCKEIKIRICESNKQSGYRSKQCIFLHNPALPESPTWIARTVGLPLNCKFSPGHALSWGHAMCLQPTHCGHAVSLQLPVMLCTCLSCTDCYVLGNEKVRCVLACREFVVYLPCICCVLSIENVRCTCHVFVVNLLCICRVFVV